MTFSTDLTADAPHIQDLRGILACIAGHMIPRDAGLGMPGADDPAIVQVMVDSVNRDRALLVSSLSAIEACVGGSLHAMEATEQAAALAILRTDRPDLFAVIEGVVSRAYYRDDRVLRALTVPVRPPFPEGYEIDPSDWDLLAPVRNMPERYRRVEHP